MENTFEEIRKQIHDIRNFLAPFDLKLAGLDERIAKMRVLFDERFGEYESKLLGTSFKVEEQGTRLSDLMDRVHWIETTLNIPPRPARKSAWPLENESRDSGASA